MFVAPPDLADGAVLAAVRAGWLPSASTIVYQPVGFGSHHWRVDGRGEDGTGSAFVTVDDLDKQCHGPHDSRDAAFARLEAAAATAHALRAHAGLDFVVGPDLAADGSVLRRVTDRYAVAVYPYLHGRSSGDEGFADPADRDVVVDFLVDLHEASSAAAHLVAPDVAEVPNRDGIEEGIDRLGKRWDCGPYGERARRLLARHAGPLATLVAAYDRQSGPIITDAADPVVTHGEPSASNVMVTPDGLRLVDWESARLAPRERDLWALAEQDPAVLDRYAARAGRPVRLDTIRFYRLWYDLFEIGGYLRLFLQDHDDDANTRESWKNLEYFLRPAERWPGLVEAPPATR